MKPEEVPQDYLPYYARGRKAIYAVDDGGNFGTVASSGWAVEDAVTSAAADEYARLAKGALTRARAGQSSPLEFHMYAQRMDLPQLAQSVRLWRWRVRRHLRPTVFARLAPKFLARYADVLGMTVEQLTVLPTGDA